MDKSDKVFLVTFILLIIFSAIALVDIIIINIDNLHWETGACIDWANSAVKDVPIRCFNELTKGR